MTMLSVQKPKEEEKNNETKKQHTPTKSLKINNTPTKKSPSKLKPTPSKPKSTPSKLKTTASKQKSPSKKQKTKPKPPIPGKVKKQSHELMVPSSSTKSQDVVFVEKHEGEEVSHKTKKRNNSESSIRADKKNAKKAKKTNEEKSGEEEICRFPMQRIRRIIKSEATGLQCSRDFVFLINKATEKFLENFSEKSYECKVHDKKKSLAYKHLSSVVSKERRFDFLADYVPEQLSAKDALAALKAVEAKQS